MELKINLFRKISALHQTDKCKNVRVANDLTKSKRKKDSCTKMHRKGGEDHRGISLLKSKARLEQGEW